MDKIKVGKFLKSLREQKGKKQFQVAIDLEGHGIKVSDKTVAKWEKGNFPDLDKLGIIAEYYGVKVSDILHGEVYTQQNFEKKYFIVNDEWMHNCHPDELYQTRVDQERIIKARVKKLLIELIEKKSLTAMQNDELSFLLDKFYSISDYAININNELENDDETQVKLLRFEIYREILSMHDSTVDEIYWEIKKFFNYNRRATFRDVRGYETNIAMTEKLLNELEDWEKDLLLAQVQTQNISGYYDKLTYLRDYGIDYDEEQITKEGIKLLIKCGAKLNKSLLGYTLRRYEHYSIIDRMETLQAEINTKRLVSQYDNDNECIELFWTENNQKSRLIDLYYMINCNRKDDGKLSLGETYKLFMNNDEFPKKLLFDRYKKFIKPDMSLKEQELYVERMGVGEISTWRKYKEQEERIENIRPELIELEDKWNAGERIGTVEYEEWVGEKDGELTEGDILLRLAQMTYTQYTESRDTKLTEKLLTEIDMLSLDEIRQKYFPVEERYEEL